MRKSTMILLMMAICTAIHAQQVIRLYPGKAPGSEKWNWTEPTDNKDPRYKDVSYNAVDPTLTVFLPDPDKANGTAVVICPGGGFHILAMAHEGYDVAKWLNDRGVAAFVLKYRLVHTITDNPAAEMMPLLMDLRKLDRAVDTVVTMAVEDGKKALTYVREHAMEYKLDPKKIGIMGFSAGATTTLGVAFSDDAKSRPDFIAPIYPYLGNVREINVPENAPPMFVCAASDDELNLAPHSIRIYEAWLAAKKPAELHLYQKGGHGFGMQKKNLPTDQWIERFGEWLQLTGFLPKK